MHIFKTTYPTTAKETEKNPPKIYMKKSKGTELAVDLFSLEALPSNVS